MIVHMWNEEMTKELTDNVKRILYRAGRLAGFWGLVVILVLTPLFVYATTEDSLKSELESLQQSMNQAALAYEEQEQELANIQAQAEEVAGHIVQTDEELRVARAHLSEVAVERYRGIDDYQLLQMLFSARSFKDFITVLEYTSRIGEYYAAAIEETRILSEQLENQKTELAGFLAQQEDVVASYRKDMNKLQSQLNSKESEFEEVRQALAAKRAADDAAAAAAIVQPTPARTAAAGVAPDKPVTVSVGSNGFVFPVVGPCTFIDSYYAPRSNGMHEGTDIMAAYGTPVVAFTAGYWERMDNALGGIAGYIKGSNGWQAYYGHLQSAIASGPVGAGELVGTVGDTGNATGVPHLHLEMWDSGGAKVNPYPLLLAMQ